MSARGKMPPITLATKITVIRLLGIPVFVVLLVYYLSGIKAGTPDETYRHGALIAFVLIAATDALDGYLARRRGEVSRLGAILDPIADKALMLSGLIMLTRPSIPELSPHIPLWFTGLVISRDVFLVAGAFLVRHFSQEVHITPHVTGKAATALQVIVITWVLLQAESPWFTWVVIAAGTFTTASWALYLVDGLRQLESGHVVNKDEE